MISLLDLHEQLLFLYNKIQRCLIRMMEQNDVWTGFKSMQVRNLKVHNAVHDDFAREKNISIS